ncbi:PadR family transcriptional regulator [Cellulosimicrobium cellulans]|uniref:PadR family transcriptional regulator n=1 Tax=Cellulosimicrobium cellulans TaxID=1710 RepID=UPI001F05333D|nr:PadR family transcriptional regulator [Cellulosimicrobium cellulans]
MASSPPAFRMTEPAYLVLLAVSGEPRHGYAVIQAVRELSDGRTRLGAGTLYGNLDRLVAAGLVEPTSEEVVDGRLRRYYRATDDGRRAARAETLRLAELAERARRSLARGAASGAAGGLAGSGA